MAAFLDNSFSLVALDNPSENPTTQDLKTALERGTDETKVETMKKIVTLVLNGNSLNDLLMHIIRFVMPSKSKPLKKLLYFYYEICPKLDANGKLKQEMILVWYVERFKDQTTCTANRRPATASAMTCNTPMNSYEETPFASWPNFENPN
jgi:hypothetical protein